MGAGEAKKARNFGRSGGRGSSGGGVRRPVVGSGAAAGGRSEVGGLGEGGPALGGPAHGRSAKNEKMKKMKEKKTKFFFKKTSKNEEKTRKWRK